MDRQSFTYSVGGSHHLRALLIYIVLANFTGLTAFAQETLVQTYDFRNGSEGWAAEFADCPPNSEAHYQLEAGIRALPEDLGIAGTGYLVKGLNHSDDLAMLIKRRLTKAEGLRPRQSYVIDYVIEFASNAQSNCVGVGGAPGEGVLLLAGASPIEPRAVPSSYGDEAMLRWNTPPTNPDSHVASVAGNIANGTPCGTAPTGYKTVVRKVRHKVPVSASDDGSLWLMVLTDSGYESTTALYYMRITVSLTPVPGVAGLINLSTRAESDPTADIIAGFVIRGSESQLTLMRGVGPGLLQHGVTHYLSDPQLQLYDANGETIAMNRNWSDAPNLPELREATARAGAFPLAESSGDAALLMTLPPGRYTASLRSESRNTGTALLEVYNPASLSTSGPMMLNLSARALVGHGNEIAIAGLVVAPPFPVTVMIRAVGPGLKARFGIADFAKDPAVRLHSGSRVVASNNDWSENEDARSAAQWAATVGAFPLEYRSKDGVIIATLSPGAYTAHISNADEAAGTALLEIYRLP